MLVLCWYLSTKEVKKPSELFSELKETWSPANQANIRAILLGQLPPGRSYPKSQVPLSDYMSD